MILQLYAPLQWNTLIQVSLDPTCIKESIGYDDYIWLQVMTIQQKH